MLYKFIVALNKFKKRLFLVIFALVFLALVAFFVYTLSILKTENAFLKETIKICENNTEHLSQIIKFKNEDLKAHKKLLTSVQSKLRKTGTTAAELRQAVRKATEAADIFNKLNTIDKEVLEKYSKVYFLNEHYTPKSLIDIPNNFVWRNKNLKIKAEVYPFLMDMLNEMTKSGLSPRVVSAYRSFGTQANLKYRHRITFGTTEANKFVADQGYSEHQLGTTVDITDSATGGLNGFEKTDEYKWLTNNAFKYGFILSYPKGNQYYAYEPWHWRFVGKSLARYLHDNNENFYDVPQREINKYLINVFDGS